jgi:probable HAF family extracellular repeat protein
MHDLGTLGSGDSWALGINSAGQVVGSSRTSINTTLPSSAFVWSDLNDNRRGDPGARVKRG